MHQYLDHTTDRSCRFSRSPHAERTGRVALAPGLAYITPKLERAYWICQRLAEQRLDPVHHLLRVSVWADYRLGPCGTLRNWRGSRECIPTHILGVRGEDRMEKTSSARSQGRRIYSRA